MIKACVVVLSLIAPFKGQTIKIFLKGRKRIVMSNVRDVMWHGNTIYGFRQRLAKEPYCSSAPLEKTVRFIICVIVCAWAFLPSQPISSRLTAIYMNFTETAGRYRGAVRGLCCMMTNLLY